MKRPGAANVLPIVDSLYLVRGQQVRASDPLPAHGAYRDSVAFVLRNFQAAHEAYRNSPAGKDQAAALAAESAARAERIKKWGAADAVAKDELPTAHALRQMQWLLAEL